MLKNVKSDEELEIPAFMRQRGMMASRRPVPVAPSASNFGRRPIR
jgi:hypothetical protein